jgi:PAS domain S-box-containing protein
VIKEVLSGKAVEASAFEITRVDGSQTFVEANASPVFEGGKVTGVEAVVRDITRRRQAEDALHFQASLLNQIGRSVVVIDLAGIITYWNRQSEELYGWKREEVIGKRAKEVLAYADPNSLREGIWKDLLQSGHWNGEVEIRRKNGARFPALATAAPINNPSGLVVGYSFVAADITKRREIEKRLHDSEEQFRGIAERSFDGIFLLDTNGSVTYASPSLCRILGSKSEDVIGQPVTKYLPVDSIPRLTRALDELMRGRTIDGFETEGRKKDGSPFLLQISASPIFDEGYSVAGIQGVLRDVTELRLSEEPRKLLASIIESMPIGIVSIGLDGTIIFWNPAAERIAGYSAKEMIGRPASVLRPLDRVDEQTRVLETLKNMEGTRAISYESTWVRKDGSQFDFAADAFPIKDAFGKTNRFTCLFRDITAQKAAEEKIRSLQEARSRFISAATHELKTPLVSIKGYADLAVSGSLGELSKPLEHGLAVVGRNVERMLNLIQELLEIERMDNGKMEVSKEVVDLAEVISESVDNLRPVMRGKQLEVDVVLPEAGPRVMGDKMRLDEVMDNLLVNAVKFTPEKGKLRVVLAEEAGQVCVSVTDSGIGISPTNLQNLFEPFSKIPKSGLVENQEIYGLYSTGLGLAVTRRIVGLHGGRIWAESPGEGQGSTFFFTLPRISQ